MSNVENVCPQVLRGVTRELRRLAAHPPAGVKLLLRDDDLTDVLAHIDGPADTPYAGGVFRVRLVLGREFPAAPPRAYFLTRIFHPNVSPATGEVCVNTLKRDWRPELGLEHALLAVKCLLIAPNPESALNADAAALLRDRYDDYFARAKLLADIHARPLEPAKQQDGPAAGGAEQAASASRGGEEGPCAKRERRPAAAAAAAGQRAAKDKEKDRRRILKRL
ncbi:ubiquitin-conjugating enzyme E2 S [Ostrinia nubilalis]|uniref:ubiquitin-conjugating enzyme E2 S n=1 Tax=Ostrinia nubilalis TaxID=29057 RepID=UPI0030826597